MADRSAITLEVHTRDIGYVRHEFLRESMPDREGGANGTAPCAPSGHLVYGHASGTAITKLRRAERQPFGGLAVHAAFS